MCATVDTLAKMERKQENNFPLFARGREFQRQEELSNEKQMQKSNLGNAHAGHLGHGPQYCGTQLLSG